MTNKNRLFNKYNLFLLLFMSVIPVIIWIFTSNYLFTIFNYVPRTNALEDSLQSYLAFRYKMEYFLIESYQIFEVITPLLASFAVYHFMIEKEGLFQNAYVRVRSYRRFILRSVLSHTVIAGVVVYLGFLCCICLGLVFNNPETSDFASRTLFADIFGADFYKNYMYLYYLLEGFIKYFVAIAVYGLATIVISLYVQKKYIAVFIPSAYFILFTLIFSLMEQFDITVSYLSPSYFIYASSADAPTYAAFLGFLPVIILSVIGLFLHIKGNERIGN